MIRRSLRIGIRLGMLGGLAFALFKVVQARRPLPAMPPGDDPWVPTWAPDPAPASAPARAPAPASAPARAPEPDEPALVQPTMLHSTSLKRRDAGTGDRSFDPASTAPPVVAAANPFAPAAPPAPTLVPPATAEIEPDDDEIVILSTGDDTAAPTPAPPALEVVPETPARPRAAAKAPARKAAAKAGAPEKATASKKSAPKKSAPKKPAATKSAATKSAATESAARKRPAKKATAQRTAAKRGASGAQAWVEPEGGVCPTSHPVKAKLRSAIFHLPGMAAYARTAPDRCYRDEAAATDDGLRKAAR